MKSVREMTNDELEREVTDLRNRERTLRKARRISEASDLHGRISELALEQGWREAEKEK